MLISGPFPSGSIARLGVITGWLARLHVEFIGEAMEVLGCYYQLEDVYRSANLRVTISLHDARDQNKASMFAHNIEYVSQHALGCDPHCSLCIERAECSAWGVSYCYNACSRLIGLTIYEKDSDPAPY
jgi:hypothetical protein